MARTYRSARGKQIDMAAIVLKNEKTIAIGNAGVNAAGDKLGPNGVILKTRNELMSEHYRVNTTVAEDSPVVDSSKLIESDIVDKASNLEDQDFEVGNVELDGELAKKIEEGK